MEEELDNVSARWRDRRAPDALEQLLLGERPVGVARQRAQQLELLGRCRVSGKRLASNGQLVIMARRGGDLFACRRRSGQHKNLSVGEPFFRPPARAVKVAGPLVGFAINHTTDGATAEDSTRLIIADTRRLRLYERGPKPRYGARLDLGGLVEIGSLAVDRNRRLAWIECRDRDPSGSRASARPNCVKPGSRAKVLLADASMIDNRFRLLDEGSRVDPRSVRICEGRVSWIRAGRRYSRSVR